MSSLLRRSTLQRRSMTSRSSWSHGRSLFASHSELTVWCRVSQHAHQSRDTRTCAYLDAYFFALKYRKIHSRPVSRQLESACQPASLLPLLFLTVQLLWSKPPESCIVEGNRRELRPLGPSGYVEQSGLISFGFLLRRLPAHTTSAVTAAAAAALHTTRYYRLVRCQKYKTD